MTNEPTSINMSTTHIVKSRAHKLDTHRFECTQCEKPAIALTRRYTLFGILELVQEDEGICTACLQKRIESATEALKYFRENPHEAEELLK